MMDKIWLKSYPRNVPAEIDADKFSSVNAMFEHACGRFRDRPAFGNQSASITFGELDALSRAFAACLQREAGLSKGDRIALMMPNLLQYPVALFGALRAGCVVVNTNPLYTARELRDQLADSGAACIVVLENFAHTLEEALPETAVRSVITTRIGDMLHFPVAQLTNFVVKHVRHMVPEWHISGATPFPKALERGRKLEFDAPAVHGDDIAFLQYTGGTTGVPKGAILTHRNIIANVEQTIAWAGGVLEEGGETAVIPLPLYHVFALTVALAFFRFGANNVLITNPRDIEGLVKELKHTKFSVMIGVNTLFGALLNSPHIGEVDASRVKAVIAGGMAVLRTVAEKWQHVFGVPLIEGYGLTEASPVVSANPFDIPEYTGMIGLPFPSTEVSIRNEQNKEMAPGELGEICVKGPQVMRGYWNMPDETANVFTNEGWLRTGDIGYMNERGYIKLVDRKKDVIVVSGFKVFPNEIEDVVAMHPDVLEVAAVPAADERTGEVVKIVVVRQNPALTVEALLEHCRKNLTGYKVPRYVVFREQLLPKSNIGKILRRVVKEEEDGTEQSHGMVESDHHEEHARSARVTVPTRS